MLRRHKPIELHNLLIAAAGQLLGALVYRPVNETALMVETDSAVLHLSLGAGSTVKANGYSKIEQSLVSGNWSEGVGWLFTQRRAARQDYQTAAQKVSAK